MKIKSRLQTAEIVPRMMAGAGIQRIVKMVIYIELVAYCARDEVDVVGDALVELNALIGSTVVGAYISSAKNRQAEISRTKQSKRVRRSCCRRNRTCLSQHRIGRTGREGGEAQRNYRGTQATRHLHHRRFRDAGETMGAT